MNRNDIKLWYIYFDPHCRHVRPEPKGKFVVVVGFEGESILGFLINSRTRPYISNNPNLAVCETIIYADQHRVLERDSRIDCGNLYSFLAWDFQSQKGRLSEDAKRSILEAVRACPTLKKKHKALILANGDTG